MAPFPQENPTPKVVSQRQAFEFFLLIMLGGYLFIDTLNGLFVGKLGLPNILAAGYKQALLLLLLVYAFCHAHRRFIISIGILLCVLSWALLRFFAVDGLDSFYAFQEAIKVAYLFILVTILSSFVLLNKSALTWIMGFSVGVIVFNVLSTFAGFGNTTYSDFGAKGFLYSGNAVSGVVVICASYFLVKSYLRSLILFSLLIVFFSLLSLVIGTKSGFLGVLVAAALVMMFYADARTLLLITILIIGLVAFSYFFMDVIQDHPLYHRIKFFYDTGGLERVVFSGRDNKLSAIWPLLVSGEILPFLLGADFGKLVSLGVTRVEFDWIDMQINFGFIPSLIVYCAYSAIFFYLLILKKNEIVNTAIIAFVVLLLISSIAGHVMYNGTVTPLWATIIAAAIKSALTQTPSVFAESESKTI